MKVFFRAIALVGMVGCVTYGATLNFDALAAGTAVTNQFAASGVVFGSSPGTFIVDDNTYGNAVLTPSIPNYLAIGGNGIFDFMVGPNTGAVNSFSFSSVGLANGFGYYNGATVTTYDIDGVLLNSLTIDPVGPFQAVDPVTYLFLATGIHEVRFAAIQNPGGNALFAIDDLSFAEVTEVSPTGAPEPTTALLAAAGIGLCLLRKRSR